MKDTALNPLSSSRTNNATSVALPQGRMQPNNVELERAVLGGILIDKRGLDEVIDILIPEVFHRIHHNQIFKAIEELFRASEAVDVFTVSDRLKKMKALDSVGGLAYLNELTQIVTSSAHIEHHARILQQKYIARELISTFAKGIETAYNPSEDVFDLLDWAEGKLFSISSNSLKKHTDVAHNLVQEAILNIKKVSEKGGFSGVPSGFIGIDSITAGWQKSDLIILAARPGMGKTAFVLSMARNMAVTHKIPVAVFSLEMSSVQLITRMISSETGISAEKLRKGQLNKEDWSRLYEKVKNLEDAPVYIDDTPALSVFELRAKCRRLVSKHQVGAIVVDYLQLMTVGGGNKGGNREQEISTISRSLKAIAKELGVPIIALSQLSRAVETRAGDKRPQLSDLRESGAIEQDADIVCFIYRPEYYGLETWEDDTPTHNTAEFIIAKHRNGALDRVRLRFIKEQAKFEDYLASHNHLLENADPVLMGSKINDDTLDAFDSNNGISFEKASQNNIGDSLEETEDSDILAF